MNVDFILNSEELLISAALLLAPVPFLLLGARQNRKFWAAAPGLLSFALFLAAFANAHWTTWIPSSAVQSAHTLAALIFLAMLIPAIFCLRNRWLALLHVSTLLGITWSWFIGVMMVARDGL